MITVDTQVSRVVPRPAALRPVGWPLRPSTVLECAMCGLWLASAAVARWQARARCVCGHITPVRGSC